MRTALSRNTIAIVLAFTAVTAIARVAHSVEDHTINISGSSPEACILPTAATHSVNFSELTDPQDGTIESSTMTVQIGTMSCNYGVALALRTQNGALTRSIPAGVISGEFTDKVQYTAVVDWNGSTFSLATDGTPLKTASSTLGPTSDSLVVNITTLTNGTKMLVSGNYSDTLTLRIGGVF